MWRTIRVLAGFAALIGGVFAASPLLVAEAAVDEYGPVEWLPVEGQSTLWCTVGTQDGCADRYHHDYFAIDISVTTSTPIVAAGRGQVTLAIGDQPENCPILDAAYCRSVGREGNKVVVTHADGVTSYYGHMSQVLVEAGDWVEESTVLGFGGDSGPANGMHLHFEVRDSAGNPITVGSLRACNGSTPVSYPGQFGARTWDDAPAFNSVFNHDGAGACIAASGPTIVSDGPTLISGAPTVVSDGPDVVTDEPTLVAGRPTLGSDRVILVGSGAAPTAPTVDRTDDVVTVDEGVGTGESEPNAPTVVGGDEQLSTGVVVNLDGLSTVMVVVPDPTPAEATDDDQTEAPQAPTTPVPTVKIVTSLD